jgi:hypothetical protein
MDIKRRDLFRYLIVTGGIGLAGCTESNLDPTSSQQSGNENNGPSGDSASTVTETSSVVSSTVPPMRREWGWEFEENCQGDESHGTGFIIRVKRVRSSEPNEGTVIYYHDLTKNEKDIFNVVLDDGGYGECDSFNSFDKFAQRIENKGNVENNIYLEHEDLYYQLYLVRQDLPYG